MAYDSESPSSTVAASGKILVPGSDVDDSSSSKEPSEVLQTVLEDPQVCSHDIIHVEQCMLEKHWNHVQAQSIKMLMHISYVMDVDQQMFEKIFYANYRKDNEIGYTKLILIMLTCLKEEKTVFFYSSH